MGSLSQMYSLPPWESMPIPLCLRPDFVQAIFNRAEVGGIVNSEGEVIQAGLFFVVGCGGLGGGGEKELGFADLIDEPAFALRDGFAKERAVELLCLL